jgi:hypothetical protein
MQIYAPGKLTTLGWYLPLPPFIEYNYIRKQPGMDNSMIQMQYFIAGDR